MILIDFPGPEQRPLELDLICPEMGGSNIIALTRAEDTRYPELHGTLSVKCAFNGVEQYTVEGRRIPLDEASYLIVNQGQRYSSTAATACTVESLCVFFRPGFADEILRDSITPDDRLLADPSGAQATPVYFFDKLYHHDDSVSPVLRKIRSVLQQKAHTKGWAEEQYHTLLYGMLRAHRNVLHEILRLPALRQSTRVEIYRRLTLAREFMLNSYTQHISLKAIAREASLSPHHFLRLFKSLYSITPHQYLTSLRIKEAQKLLSTTDRPITDICSALGFESSTSFSLLFGRHVGSPPRDYRKSLRGQ